MSREHGSDFALKEKHRHGTASFPCAFYQADASETPGVPFIVKHHWHEEIELVHLIHGSFHVEINMTPYDVNEECLCLIGREELHYIRSDQDYLEDALLFAPSMLRFEAPDLADDRLLGPLMRGELTLPAFLFPSQLGWSEIMGEFERIHRSFRNGMDWFADHLDPPDMVSQLQIKASLLNILASLYAGQYLTSPRPDVNPHIEDLKLVMTYIREHYRERIHLADLAALVNMNEQYFCRFFKKGLGKTPIAYVNEYRIRQAVLLLRSTRMPVTEISLECGFNNLGHFISEFRRSTGETPLQARKSSAGGKD